MFVGDLGPKARPADTVCVSSLCTSSGRFLSVPRIVASFQLSEVLGCGLFAEGP